MTTPLSRNLTRGSPSLPSKSGAIRVNLRQKKMQMRALRLKRHRKEAEQEAPMALMNLGVPPRRLMRILHAPLRLPKGKNPVY